MSRNKIDDIYPLSPIQQGMLFHTLYSPKAGLYFEQSVYSLYGDFNVSAFKQAWQRVVDCHPILRTLFLWERRKEPLQVVRARVELRWLEDDWRKLSSDEQQERLETFLKSDRDQNFKLSEAPLLRFALIQLADDGYLFIWSRHHLLLDRWSRSLVLEEVSAFYDALCHGRDLRLTSGRPYRDYITWLHGQDLSQAEAFWRRALTGFTTPTTLEIERPSGDLQGEEKSENVYDSQEIRVSEVTTALLQSLIREQRFTLNTIVQGAWALILSRYTRQEDIVFGATVSGRTADLEGVESMVGLFINTLPVRVDVCDDNSLVSWLKKIQNYMVELQQFEYSPLVQIQEWSEMPRGIPLFDSIIVFENVRVDRFLREQEGKLKTNYVLSRGARTNYPLVLMAVPGAELLLRITYDVKRYDGLRILRMLGHLRTLLENFVAHPDQRLSDLQLLTRPERRQLLTDWNDTKRDYPKDKRVHELFEAQADRTPNAVAVIFKDKQLTYQELNRQANQLASYLKILGVGYEALVGIYVERSLEMAVAVLAVLKAGGAYVPLDPLYPKERLAFMLEDSQAKVVLTQKSLVDSLPAHSGQVVCLDTAWPTISRDKEDNVAKAAIAENLAYVIYTSGSTGRPKAVALPHGALSNLIAWQVHNLRQETSRTLQFTSLSFDVSFQEIFTTWCSGGTLVIPSESVRQDVNSLLRFIADKKIDRIFLPFVALQQLAEVSSGQYKMAESLREIITAGEQLHVTPHIIGLFSRLRDCYLFNQYGPSESHVVSAFTLSDTAERWPMLPPIGRPIDNTEIYLLDHRHRPVPVGVPGELYIGGAGLARGYLNHPDLTAEKFIPNPFSTNPGTRLYATGDLSRYLPDGNIEFLGRIDHQVKIRGSRVELGEIEAVLRQHPAVSATVVIPREESPTDKRLVAYVVTNRVGAPAAADLRKFLKDRLPDYMVPSGFVMLDEMPLTPSGKVNRRALPAPDQSRPELDETFVAPRTPIEQALAEIWAEILKLEQIGVRDNFFALGGHSLLATRVISRINNTFQVELPLRVIFEAPTLSGLADRILAARESELGLEFVPPIRSVPRDRELPLSFAQQRLWFLDQLEPGNPTFNMQGAFRLTGRLDLLALEQSVNEIIRRHETLRTTFAIVEGQPIQVIAPSLTIGVRVIDLEEVHDDTQEFRVPQLTAEEFRRPFNLARGPLVRATILRLGSQNHILLLAMHHIVSDGWSMGVLYRELSVLYKAFADGDPSPLSDISIQYADYAVWQRQWLEGKVLENQLSYWKRQLEGSPQVLELPGDHPRPRVQTYQGERQSLALSKQLLEALRKLSHQENVTLFMTLAAVFQTLLNRYTGQDDIIVGTPIAGRHRSETEELIGCFLNNLALRTNLGGNPTFRELLIRVRQAALGAYTHQDLPFEKLLEELRTERDLSRTPLFQVYFNMFSSENRLELSGLTVEPLSRLEASSKFDLTLYVKEQNQEIRFDLVYNRDIFAQSRMAEMLRQLEHLLSQVVQNPDYRIADFSLVTPSARRFLPNPAQQLENDWQGAVHKHFSVQAQRFPRRLAVVDQWGSWTYEELNSCSNRIANYLLANGIKSEEIVAIYGYRSASLVCAIMGILKAGAAFLVLDPAYPALRHIDSLKAAKPGAWVQLEAAGSVPDTLSKFIKRLSLPCHLQLPNHLTAISGEALVGCSTDDPGVKIEADDLAYVAFTSGSTGHPKGILGRHGPLSYFLPWQQETFQLDASDRFSMLSGLSHDPLQRDIFTPLWLGATICIPDPEIIGTCRLADWLADEGITFAHLTPAMAQLLAETGSPDRHLHSLRNALFVGDKLTRHDVVRLRRLTPSVRCINTYGSTESQRAVGYYVVGEEQDREVETDGNAAYPLGRGIKDVQLLILSRDKKMAGVGELGEIYIRSPHLARGYLGNDELTASRFLTNPFTGAAGDRLYKTGDMGRYSPNGDVVFVGRADSQVKIRGFRIELGEIEAILSQHPAVNHAVAVALEEASSHNRLVAYIVPKTESVPPKSELRDFLKVKLPDYMIPSAFVAMDSLPLTPNGKLNRHALPRPDETGSNLETYQAPRTPAEKIAAKIWADMLKVDRVGIHDNFFDLGGHSLLATRVISRIRQEFQTDLSLRTLFENPTVADLAAQITEMQQKRAVPEQLTEVLGDLEVLSDEEAERQLSLEASKLV